jgi:serine/threonine-protein kinase ATR
MGDVWPPNAPLGYFTTMIQPFAPNESISIESILKSNALQLVYCLVIYLGNIDDRSKSERALTYVASHLSPSSSLSAFLFGYALGILAKMQDVILSPLQQSVLDRVQVVRALKAFINLLGESVSRLSSQLVSLLQLCLQQDDLLDDCLQSWLTFICSLSSTVLVEIVPLVTSHLIKVEDRCTRDQKLVLVAIFEYIVIEKGGLVAHGHLPLIYSTDPLWDRVKATLEISSTQSTFEETLKTCMVLLGHDNALLVNQTLERIKSLFFEHEIHLYRLTVQEDLNSIISPLIQKLVRVVIRFQGNQIDVAMLACECLGMIGAIEPSRMPSLEFHDYGSWSTMAIGLGSSDDINLFAIHLMQNHFVPWFQSSSDSKIQTRIAYTIQELLPLVGFTAKVVQEAQSLSKTKNNRQPTLADRWKAFSPQIASILEPLISSRYYMEPSRRPPKTYPLFEPAMSYTHWLCDWTLDLISKQPSGSARKIFEVCAHAVDIPDFVTAQLLIPHLVCSIVGTTDSSDSDEIRKEICHILSIQVPESRVELVEQHRLCVQVYFD